MKPTLEGLSAEDIQLLKRKGIYCAVRVIALLTLGVLLLSLLGVPLLGFTYLSLLIFFGPFFIWAYLLGGFAGKKVAQGINPYFAGLMLSFCVLFASTLTGEVIWFLKRDFSFNLFSFQLFFVVGTLPALLLGLVWGKYLKQSKKMISQERVAHG